MKIVAAWKSVFDTKVDALGLSLFRICYVTVLLFEISGIKSFHNIIYDKVPFFKTGEFDFIYLVDFWYIALVFLMFGLCTRTAAIINYIFGVIIFAAALDFEYHVFCTYIIINLFLIFLPVSRVFSLDSLIEKVKNTGLGRPYQIDRKILEINYLLPVFAGIGLIYFDSVFLKLRNHLWTSGLGVWLPSSLPMMTWNDMTPVLNQHWLMIFLGYFVVLFEAAFIFLMWFRKWRVSLVLIGMFFHVGIYFSYPIPYFALTYIVIYILLLPPRFWYDMARKIKFKKPLYRFYYDAECPLCNKVVAAIKHLDVFNAVECLTVQGNYSNDASLKKLDEEQLLINIHGVRTSDGKVFIGYYAYSHLFRAMRYLFPIGIVMEIPGISAIGEKIYAYIAGDRLTIRCTAENCALPMASTQFREDQDIMVKGWNRLVFTKASWKIVIILMFLIQCIFVVKLMPDNIAKFLKAYTGIARHGVFLDHHFKGYNHEIRVVFTGPGNRKTIPLIDDNGMPGKYISGITWKNMSFNVVTSTFNQKQVERGLTPFLQYYLNDTHKSFAGAHFELYYKEIETPEKWEKDFLRKQIAKPWIKAADIIVNGRSADYRWERAMGKIFEEERMQAIR